MEGDLNCAICPYLDPEIGMIENKAFTFVGSAYFELAPGVGESLSPAADCNRNVLEELIRAIGNGVHESTFFISLVSPIPRSAEAFRDPLQYALNRTPLCKFSRDAIACWPMASTQEEVSTSIIKADRLGRIHYSNEYKTEVLEAFQVSVRSKEQVDYITWFHFLNLLLPPTADSMNQQTLKRWSEEKLRKAATNSSVVSS
jgi:hypothetical protein